MTGFNKILLVAWLAILLPQAAPATATQNVALRLNFGTDTRDKNEARNPELKISAETTPSRRTTLINYRIFSCRRIPVSLNQHTYSQLEVAGCGFTSEPGNPTLPVKTIFLEFPDNHNYNARILTIKTSRIKDISLLPAQPAAPETAETDFVINHKIYQNNAYYPAGRLLNVKVVRLRQRRLLEIRLTPVRFQPRQREVDFAYEIDLEVTFTTVDENR